MIELGSYKSMRKLLDKYCNEKHAYALYRSYTKDDVGQSFTGDRMIETLTVVFSFEAGTFYFKRRFSPEEKITLNYILDHVDTFNPDVVDISILSNHLYIREKEDVE